MRVEWLSHCVRCPPNSLASADMFHIQSLPDREVCRVLCRARGLRQVMSGVCTLCHRPGSRRHLQAHGSEGPAVTTESCFIYLWFALCVTGSRALPFRLGTKIGARATRPPFPHPLTTTLAVRACLGSAGNLCRRRPTTMCMTHECPSHVDGMVVLVRPRYGKGPVAISLLCLSAAWSPR